MEPNQVNMMDVAVLEFVFFKGYMLRHTVMIQIPLASKVFGLSWHKH
jgi:hypothetical protein